VLSTLAIGLVVWIAGVAFATRFGSIVDTVASVALVAFGGWIMISALREMRGSNGYRHGHGHSHGHTHDFSHLAGHTQGGSADGVHGPELQRIETGHGTLELSIFEAGVPPRFRLTGAEGTLVRVETVREGGTRQSFAMANRGRYWESTNAILEPHGFTVTVEVDHGGHTHAYQTAFAEHEHGHGDHGHDHDDGYSHADEPVRDALYAPLGTGAAVLARHVHAHRHGNGSAHAHLHDHETATAHDVSPDTEAAPPWHTHKHKTSSRTALLLILGSSPMVEGIPAFFAAGKYGVGLILLMAAVFVVSTIATYVLLCVYSAAGLQRLKLGAFERYGEVLSGAFIALVGVAFYVWPIL